MNKEITKTTTVHNDGDTTRVEYRMNGALHNPDGFAIIDYRRDGSIQWAERWINGFRAVGCDEPDALIEEDKGVPASTCHNERCIIDGVQVFHNATRHHTTIYSEGVVIGHTHYLYGERVDEEQRGVILDKTKTLKVLPIPIFNELVGQVLFVEEKPKPVQSAYDDWEF